MKFQMNYKMGFFLLLFILLIVTITACSAQTQARWSGTIKLEMPKDVLYVDGVPQGFSISRQTSGDVILSYVSDHHSAVGQTYGCAVISITCDQLFMQGRYELEIPQDKWLK